MKLVAKTTDDRGGWWFGCDGWHEFLLHNGKGIVIFIRKKKEVVGALVMMVDTNFDHIVEGKILYSQKFLSGHAFFFSFINVWYVY